MEEGEEQEAEMGGPNGEGDRRGEDRKEQRKKMCIIVSINITFILIVID